MYRVLGKFESAQAMTSEFAPFNIVIVLRMHGGPEKEVLRQALLHIHRRHPMLRAAIEPWRGGYRYRVSEEARVSLQTLPRSSPDAWRAVAEEELNTGFNPSKAPLFRVNVLAGDEPDGDCELVLTAHHAIIDGVSAACLLRELMGLCESIANGEHPIIPESLELLPAADQMFPDRYRGSRAWLAKTAFLVRQLLGSTYSMYRLRRIGEPSIQAHGRCRIVPVQLPAGLTRTLNRKCRQRRITLNSLLCAVQLLLARDHAFGGRSAPLRHFVFADLRPYLSPSVPDANLGPYFAMLHLVSECGADTGPWTLAQALNRQIYGASKRGDKYASVLMSRLLMRSVLARPRFRMAHTALAFLGPVRLAADYGGIRPTALHAFVSNMALGPVYTANSRLFQGRLYWDMMYLDSDMDRNTAEQLAREILHSLAGLAGGNADRAG